MWSQLKRQKEMCLIERKVLKEENKQRERSDDEKLTTARNDL